MVLLLHSQHQYIFDYDSGDRLSAVTMPSVARHTMQTIRSIGYYRNIYTPPESNASVTVDYSEDGQVCVTQIRLHQLFFTVVSRVELLSSRSLKTGPGVIVIRAAAHWRFSPPSSSEWPILAPVVVFCINIADRYEHPL